MATYRQTKYEVTGDVSVYDLYDDDGAFRATFEVAWDILGLDITAYDGAGNVIDKRELADELGYKSTSELAQVLEWNADTTRTRPDAVMVLGGAK